MLGESVVSANLIEVLFNAIVTEGRLYSREHQSQSPLMFAYYNTESLGMNKILKWLGFVGSFGFRCV